MWAQFRLDAADPTVNFAAIDMGTSSHEGAVHGGSVFAYLSQTQATGAIMHQCNLNAPVEVLTRSQECTARAESEVEHGQIGYPRSSGIRPTMSSWRDLTTIPEESTVNISVLGDMLSATSLSHPFMEHASSYHGARGGAICLLYTSPSPRDS